MKILLLYWAGKVEPGGELGGTIIRSFTGFIENEECEEAVISEEIGTATGTASGEEGAGRDGAEVVE